MTPTWLTVDHASSRLRSLCANARTAASSIVTETETPSTQRGSGLTARSGKRPASTTVPAATIVAAWMRALAGVGPSMASASQSWNGQLRRLAEHPDDDERDEDAAQRCRRDVAGVAPDRGTRSGCRCTRWGGPRLTIVEPGAGTGGQADDAEDEPDVGDPGHEEGLVRGPPGAVPAATSGR